MNQSMLSSRTTLKRSITAQDIDKLIEKAFSKFDQDKSYRISRSEFPQVLKVLVDMIGAMEPTVDDSDDLFNLIDVNGDETLDKG